MQTATSISANPLRADAQGEFPFTPELLQLLQDAIPLICASKRDTILFFLRAGVPESWLAEMKRQVETCRSCVTKFSITQETLAKLDQDREHHQQALQEVLKRVAAFEDFSVCGPILRQKAVELVAEVRRLREVDCGSNGQIQVTPIAAQSA
jgi:hypothetical protein